MKTKIDAVLPNFRMNARVEKFSAQQEEVAYLCSRVNGTIVTPQWQSLLDILLGSCHRRNSNPRTSLVLPNSVIKNGSHKSLNTVKMPCPAHVPSH